MPPNTAATVPILRSMKMRVLSAEGRQRRNPGAQDCQLPLVTTASQFLPNTRTRNEFGCNADFPEGCYKSGQLFVPNERRAAGEAPNCEILSLVCGKAVKFQILT